MKMRFTIDIDTTNGIIEVDINGTKHACSSDDELYITLKEWAFDVAEAVAEATPTGRLIRWANEGWDG